MNPACPCISAEFGCLVPVYVLLSKKKSRNGPEIAAIAGFPFRGPTQGNWVVGGTWIEHVTPTMST
jgi:hypothetical protein